MAQTMVSTVLPGDDLTSKIFPAADSCSNNENESPKRPLTQPKLGIGLSLSPVAVAEAAAVGTPKIIATLGGSLIHRRANNTFYILANTKRYLPQLHDRVIGIIEERLGDYYRVTIPNSSHCAILHSCSFEGATKRNRPQLVSGSMVYARVSTCNTHVMDPELACTVLPGEVDGGASRKDWMTDEGTYGELKGGSTMTMSTGLARELLKPSNVVLDALSLSQLPFEICIGVNGFLWVNSTRPEYTILILNAIANSEVMTEEQVRGMVKALLKTIKEKMAQDME